MTSSADLQRQLVKSDSASLKIGLPALSLEIPSGTQKGTVSTIEGMLATAARNLDALQPDRLRIGDLDNFYRCRDVIQGLKRLILLNANSNANTNAGECCDRGEDYMDDVYPLDITLDDPAGNSFIETKLAGGDADANMKKEYYVRTSEQDLALGLQPCKKATAATRTSSSTSMVDNSKDNTIPHENALHGRNTECTYSCAIVEIDRPDCSAVHVGGRLGRDEPLKFPTPCPSCNDERAETSMCVIDIPHFKEVIIMSLLCETCGYRSNEVKPSGSISKYATKVTLNVKSNADLKREVLKSDSAGVKIPEIELELGEGGLGGIYTTVEGLLGKMYDRLSHVNPFWTGDSATMHHKHNDGGEFSEPSPNTVKFNQVLEKLKKMKEGKAFPFTLVLDDALSNSFLGPVPLDALKLAKQAEREGDGEGEGGDNQCRYQNYVDPGLEVEEYERSFEQNEALGLNDMNTEQYHSGTRTCHESDKPEELSDRLNRLDTRGVDHPHEVAKGTSDFDDTIMGQGSAKYATPELIQRGQTSTKM
jgi:zinc finger protein